MQINIQPCVQPRELRGGPNVHRVVVWYRVDCGMEDSRVSIYEHDAAFLVLRKIMFLCCSHAVVTLRIAGDTRNKIYQGDRVLKVLSHILDTILGSCICDFPVILSAQKLE
jgi:hypothetical protein